ncbi:MAG: S1 RNA-binding domain-containing protein [candidate division KSB1 bacterium]|nr:S1 RNA-binding domain-containing protein [candidate division KSB1 bacterium]
MVTDDKMTTQPNDQDPVNSEINHQDVDTSDAVKQELQDPQTAQPEPFQAEPQEAASQATKASEAALEEAASQETASVDNAPADAGEFANAVEENLELYSPRVGDRVKGKILAIHDDVAIVDCGAKSEATLLVRELDGQGVGDEVEGVIVETEPTLRLARVLQPEMANRMAIEAAYKTGIPVVGKIVEKVNGGFRVDVGGEMAFLPTGKLDRQSNENPDEAVDKTFTFKILEYQPNANKFVLSRSDWQQEEAEEKASEIFDRLKVGDVVEGKVASLHSFGAFIDLGGVEGLVHISEISENFIEHPSEVLKVGQEVRARVIKLAPESQRISLSMKSLHEEMWQEFAEQAKPGDPFKGKIKRKTDFGIFVELQPGIEGLLHISQIRSGAQYNQPEYDVGNEIEGWIRSLDPVQKRLQLTQRELPSHDPWETIHEKYHIDDVIEAKVDGMTNFGLLAEVEPGLTGLVPFSALKKMGYKKPTKAFPMGSKHRFKIANIAPDKRRLALMPELDAQQYEAQVKARRTKSKSKGKAPKSAPVKPNRPKQITEFGALLAAALQQENQKKK